MKKLVFLLTTSLALFGQAGKTTLKPGDAAPDFSLTGSDSKTYTLSQFKGKNPVVLAFFPLAFTGGWTKEITGYQAGISKFEGMDVKVLAVSADNQPTLAHWAKELGATFPLLSDHMRGTGMKYGVLLPAGFFSRTTFIIDTEGKIVEIIEGSAALDAAGSEEACRRVVKKP